MGFAIHWHESAVGVHVFPILNPSPPPSPFHPSGLSQCTSREHLSHASNLDWRSVSYMVIYYTCSNAILSDLPTLAFSHRVQNTILYICVSFAVSHIWLSLPSSKFHMYVLVYYIGVFLCLTSLSIIGSSFIHLIRTDSNVFFLMAE